MLAVTKLLNGGAGGSAGDFPVSSLSFRYGTYLQATLTTAVDSKVGTLSFWFKRVYWDTEERIIDFPGGFNPCWIDVNNYINFATVDVTGSINPCNIRTNSPIPKDFVWHHIVFAFSLPSITKCYVDGVAQTFDVTAPSNTVIDWTRASFLIGRRYDTDANYMALSLAEFYFNTNEFLDVSVPANLAKFRNAAGKPVNLGPDGSWVTGNKPQVYLHLDPGAPSSDFLLNRSGGSLTFTTGGAGGSLLPEPILPSAPWNNVVGSVQYNYGSSWGGWTIRQFFYAVGAGTIGIVNVPSGQTQVRVTVSNNSVGVSALSFSKMYIGHSAYPGGSANGWDASDLTQVFFSGAPGATIPAGQTLRSDPVNWKYNGTSPMLLTTYFTAAPEIAWSYHLGGVMYSISGDYAASLIVGATMSVTGGRSYFFMDVEMI